MAQLYYQGHGSYRITAEDGTVIYVDPYVGTGYDLPADLVLITHEHGDHNQLSLVTQKPDCRVIRSADALKNGKYQTFTVKGVNIEAVQAYNHHHKKEECVGYILTLDGITFYAMGDTALTEQMHEIGKRGLDWSVIPIDGIYTMSPEEASQCAAVIGAKHTIPVHMKPGALFDQAMAESFRNPGRVIVKPGESVKL